MCQVARPAAIDLYRRVFVDKRPLLIGVAFETDCVLRGGSHHLFGPRGAVRIVAIGALNESFIHSMMERHIELRLLLQMAGIAKLRLGFLQQEFAGFGMVWRVAGDATNAVGRVDGVDGVHLMRTARVAGETAAINFLGRMIFTEDEDFADVPATRDVRGAGAMTIFATVFADAAFLVCLLPVRAFLPALIESFMAGLAGFTADIILIAGE